MLSILQRYIYRQLLAVFGLTLCAFVLIMLMHSQLKAVQMGAPPRCIVQMLPLALPYAVSWCVPVSLVAACVVTYGRMAADNELTAVRAAGVHLFPIVMPAVVLGVLFSTVGLYVNDELTPATSNARRRLLAEMAKDASLAHLTMLADPVLEFGDDMKIVAWDLQGDELRNVIIHLREQDGQLSVIRGERARVSRSADGRTLTVNVRHGLMAHIDPRTRQTQWLQSGTLTLTRELKPKEKERRRVKHFATKELTERLRAGAFDSKWARTARIAIHARRSLALSSLAFVLIGAPLGMIARKGNKLVGFGLAVGVMFVLYYPLMVAGRALCREEVLPLWIGMWMPDVLVGGIGLVLLARLLRK